MTDDKVSENGRRARYIRSAPFVLAVIFFVALAVFEYYFFFQKYPYQIFARHLEAGNYLKLAAFFSLSFGGSLLTIAFFWIAFASTAVYRVIYFLIFTVVIFTEYGIFRAFGRFSRLVDVMMGMRGIDMAIGTDAVRMYINYLAVIPVAAFAIVLTATWKDRRRGILAMALVLAATCAYFAGTAYFTRNMYYAASFSNGFRTAVSAPVNWYLGSVNGRPEGVAYAEPRDAVTYHAAAPPERNIVFIVDESIRGDRLSLNGYQKPTTPFLDELARKGFIRNWGIAASGTTCSHTSNPLLLTGLTDLPDNDFRVYSMPTLFQYAKAMNYKNYYFDGQVDSLWNGKTSDIRDFGTWVKASDLKAGAPHLYDNDGEIARRIKEIVSTSTGNFIWVNKFGVHAPYTKSYPNEHYGEQMDAMPTLYDPNMSVAETGRIYDEAISYNLESFFRGLIADRPQKDTIYVYTSDHGQTLRENGATVSHCAESRPEAVVPLFMIGDPSWFAGVDETYRSSHANLFASVLDLMEFPQEERRYRYAISLFKATGADSRPRFYYTGKLQGDDGARYPFD